MKNVVGILSYGDAGNLKSIQRMIEMIDTEWKVVNCLDDMKLIDRLILPGVGSFNHAMTFLNRNYEIRELQIAIANIPTLGICLGMHLLAQLGYEGGRQLGLGLMKGEVTRINTDRVLPHVGFNSIELLQKTPLLNGIENEKFYFMHSYEFLNFRNVIGVSDYLGHEFISIIQNENIHAVQFHPEKSRGAGIKLMQNFAKI